VLRTLEGHLDSVNGVALTVEGEWAVSASLDQTLKVWGLESGRLARTLEGHAASVMGVAVTPDGKRAISASYDHTLKVWDLKTGLPLATFHCDASVNCCAVAGPLILAGDAAGRVHFLLLVE
jgi:WD40 repeat protein